MVTVDSRNSKRHEKMRQKKKRQFTDSATNQKQFRERDDRKDQEETT